jgi:hypothetical protein
MAPTVPTLRKKDQTPAKQVTGTSYSASPAVPVPPNSYSEIGSQLPTPIRDPLPALGSRRQAVQTYRAMVRADASVRVSLRAGKTPILGGSYFVEPYSEAEEDQVVSEFVKFNLFNAPAAPFLIVLEDILRMFDYGFSVMEPVWELREWAPKKINAAANRRKYTMIKKLAPRPTPSIMEIQYDDNGGPKLVKQQALRSEGKSEEVDIPVEKVIIFTFDKEGGALEGESILRSAYQHWFYKDILYKIDAIQKERHGIGVPDVQLQPGYSKKDKEVAHELARNLRTNEFAYIVRPPMIEVGFAELKGQLVNPLDSANHHDNMIMKNIMVQFLNLGIEGSGGGRATGATAADMFMKAMKYVANLICDYFNLYLVPKIVAYNFQTDKFPKLKVRNIGETKDFQQWAAAMSNLINQNAISVDLETEQWIREQADMPRKLGERPESLLGTSNVKAQYLLRDIPETAENEDLAGLAALLKARAAEIEAGNTEPTNGDKSGNKGFDSGGTSRALGPRDK